MKRLIFYCIVLICSFAGIHSVKAQRHEIGLQLGVSNLVGDIGRTNYFLQKPILNDLSQMGVPINLGILYRMNLNPYQTLRFNLGYHNVQFDDRVAKENYRRYRQLHGTNSIYEADIIFEYNFFPVNEEHQSMLSPYVFGGLGGMYANVAQAMLNNDFNRDASGNAIAPTNTSDFVTTAKYQSAKKFTMAIPFGVGLKYKFNYNWALSGEVTFRPTFSDALDYSVIDNSDVKMNFNKDILAPGANTKSLLESGAFLDEANRRKDDFIKDRQIGNTNSKDWINSVSLILSYSFGRPPCYCD